MDTAQEDKEMQTEVQIFFYITTTNFIYLKLSPTECY